MSALLTIINWLLSNPTILAIAGAILGALGYGWRQRRAGVKQAEAKQAERDASAISKHKEIRDETGRLSDAELDDRNAPWVRNGKR